MLLASTDTAAVVTRLTHRTRLVATAAMCSVGEYVDTGVRTQVRFCRALATTRFAAATQGACLATRPAMPGIGSMIHARAFTLPVSVGAGTHSAHTTRAVSAGDVATPAIVPITR